MGKQIVSKGQNNLTDREPYVVVIGCANIDICAKSAAKIVEHDSNPGKIHFDSGGVGKNIAHNLSLLGNKVYMLTAIGDDIFSPIIIDSCKKAKINIDYSLHCSNTDTSSYVYISEPDGEMQVAVCDAEISERINVEYLSNYLPLLNNAGAVVIDCNLSEEAISYIVNNCKSPVFADPVSEKKALKLLPSLSKIHTIKPNIYEAEQLLNQKLSTNSDVFNAISKFLEIGCKNVFISMGSSGLCFGSQLLDATIIQPQKANLINATGGGDAVMAGIVDAYIKGYSLNEAAKRAMIAGSIAVESANAVNELLSEEMLEKRMEHYYD